jgi:tetratricopeptide (TPR) repeat protein
MSDNEAILAELRKISAWADLQRKVTRWTLIGAAGLGVVLIAFALLAERLTKAAITELSPAEKPDWYNVDQSARLGEFDKAFALGETLLLKTPLNPDAHQRLARSYLAAGKIAKSREHYAEAFRLFPSEENQKLLAAIEKRCAAQNPSTGDNAQSPTVDGAPAGTLK